MVPADFEDPVVVDQDIEPASAMVHSAAMGRDPVAAVGHAESPLVSAWVMHLQSTELPSWCKIKTF